MRLPVVHPFLLGLQPKRNEKVILDIVPPIEIEPGGHDTHHSPAFGVVLNRFANDGRVSTKATPPEVIPENHYPLSAATFGISECPSEFGLYAQRLKETRSHPASDDSLGLATGQNAAGRHVGRHAVKDILVRPPILIGWVGGPDFRIIFRAFVKYDEAVRIRIRERL